MKKRTTLIKLNVKNSKKIFITVLWFILLTAVCFVCVQWHLRRNVYYKSLKYFPGTTPTFLIGNIWWFVGLYSRTKKMKHPPAVYIAERKLGATVLHRKSGMYVFWMGSEPIVTVYRAEIMETVMGVSIGAQAGENSEYVKAIHNLSVFFNERIVYPWLWKDFLFGLTAMGRCYNRDNDILHNFTNKVIRAKKEKMLAECTSSQAEPKCNNQYFPKVRRTFMDLLLNMHIKEKAMSEADIREVDTFMFEGHDTTAVGITFVLYCIGLYPNIQKKIVEEMDEIFGDDAERPITYDDTRNMKYLECVLKESRRLYPSVPVIGRKTAEPVAYGKRVTIPTNTAVHCNLLSLHRDPDFFPNPEVFDPDRFLPENSLTRHPYAYIPFSAGPRNCIGQKFAMLEEKTVVSNVLRHFNIISIDPRDKMHIKVELILRPAQEVRLKFLPRR